MGYQYFYHTMNKDAILAHSHYSDPHYDGEGAVIFGREQKGIRYEYADRLAQWDSEKHYEAWEKVIEAGIGRTAHGIEVYLQNYYDDPNLELVSIRTGTRPFDGYPWFLYGFVSSDFAE